MIISVVAAKIWYLKNVWFLLGHPVYSTISGATEAFKDSVTLNLAQRSFKIIDFGTSRKHVQGRIQKIVLGRAHWT